MKAWRRSCGLSPATRYHEELKIVIDCRLGQPPGLGQPGPHRESKPVHALMAPDPSEPLSPRHHLGDTLHAGPQLSWSRIEGAFDPKVIAAFPRRGDGGDLLDGEGKPVRRKSRQHEVPTLPHGQMGNLALVHLKHHPV